MTRAVAQPRLIGCGGKSGTGVTVAVMTGQVDSSRAEDRGQALRRLSARRVATADRWLTLPVPLVWCCSRLPEGALEHAHAPACWLPPLPPGRRVRPRQPGAGWCLRHWAQGTVNTHFDHDAGSVGLSRGGCKWRSKWQMQNSYIRRERYVHGAVLFAKAWIKYCDLL